MDSWDTTISNGYHEHVAIDDCQLFGKLADNYESIIQNDFSFSNTYVLPLIHDEMLKVSGGNSNNPIFYSKMSNDHINTIGLNNGIPYDISVNIVNYQGDRVDEKINVELNPRSTLRTEITNRIIEILNNPSNNIDSIVNESHDNGNEFHIITTGYEDGNLLSFTTDANFINFDIEKPLETISDIFNLMKPELEKAINVGEDETPILSNVEIEGDKLVISGSPSGLKFTLTCDSNFVNIENNSNNSENNVLLTNFLSNIKAELLTSPKVFNVKHSNKRLLITIDGNTIGGNDPEIVRSDIPFIKKNDAELDTHYLLHQIKIELEKSDKINNVKIDFDSEQIIIDPSDSFTFSAPLASFIEVNNEYTSFDFLTLIKTIVSQNTSLEDNAIAINNNNLTITYQDEDDNSYNINIQEFDKDGNNTNKINRINNDLITPESKEIILQDTLFSIGKYQIYINGKKAGNEIIIDENNYNRSSFSDLIINEIIKSDKISSSNKIINDTNITINLYGPLDGSSIGLVNIIYNDNNNSNGIQITNNIINKATISTLSSNLLERFKIELEKLDSISQIDIDNNKLILKGNTINDSIPSILIDRIPVSIDNTTSYFSKEYLINQVISKLQGVGINDIIYKENEINIVYPEDLLITIQEPNNEENIVINNEAKITLKDQLESILPEFSEKVDNNLTINKSWYSIPDEKYIYKTIHYELVTKQLTLFDNIVPNQLIIDNNTEFFLESDAENGSSTFTDSSLQNHTILVPGKAESIDLSSVNSSLRNVASPTITASSWYNQPHSKSSYGPQNVFDDNISTSWESVTSHANHWIEIDLGVDVIVNRFEIQYGSGNSNYTGRQLKSAKMYVESNGSWIQIYHIPNQPRGSGSSYTKMFTIEEGNKIQGRKFRLTDFTNYSSNWPMIYLFGWTLYGSEVVDIVEQQNVKHITNNPYFKKSSIYFDGDGDYLKFDTGLDWHDNANKDFTIECWWKWENTNNNGYIWGLHPQSSDHSVFIMRPDYLYFANSIAYTGWGYISNNQYGAGISILPSVLD